MSDDDFEDDDFAVDEFVEHDATIDCPHCGKEIYEDAERCPHCERYLSDEDAARRKNRGSSSSARCCVC